MWPFVLTSIDRKQYHEIKDEWFGKPEVFDRQDVIEVLEVSLYTILRGWLDRCCRNVIA